MTKELEERLCSIQNCPQLAVHTEEGASAHWLFVVFYCDEHYREAENGTPIGPAGLDSARVWIEPRGTKKPLLELRNLAIGP